MADSKREKVEQEIITSAFSMLTKTKISGFRLRELASEVGISQGHLHYYFSSKEEILLRITDYILETYRDEREIMHSEVISSPDKLLDLFLEQKQQDIITGTRIHAMLDFWVHGTVDERYGKKVSESYDSWRQSIKTLVMDKKDEYGFSDRFIDMIPNFMISLMEGAALQHLIDKEAFNLAEYFIQAHEALKLLLFAD